MTTRKCINSEMCGNETKNGYRCNQCVFNKLNILTIANSDEHISCPVCIEPNKPMVVFPNCVHSVCIVCFKEIMGYYDQFSWISPKPFGCGKCYCGEVECGVIPCKNNIPPSVNPRFVLWKKFRPGEHKQWLDSTADKIEEHVLSGKQQGIGTCPVCRSGDKHGWIQSLGIRFIS